MIRLFHKISSHVLVLIQNYFHRWTTYCQKDHTYLRQFIVIFTPVKQVIELRLISYQFLRLTPVLIKLYAKVIVFAIDWSGSMKAFRCQR